MILNIAIVVFIILEISNVAILYFAPDSKLGNGVAIFNGWHTAKKDEESRLFAKYMANWVAGSKLVFIALLIVVLIAGNEMIKVHTMIAMILSISTYFFRLHPIIKKLDSMGEVSPKGYSKKLFFMILGFVSMFTTALILHVII